MTEKHSCCFFGHRDTPSGILNELEQTITELIENDGVDTFYIGNQGGFDALVWRTLKKLREQYPHIRYNVVLAYMPIKKNDIDYSDTIYPDGLETVPKRFVIDRRNRWMIENSEYVVTYVTHSFGGAAKFYELAVKKGRKVINLAEIERQ